MSEQFSTMSTEAIRAEIENLKKKIAMNNGQQDKLMLFAMESEIHERMQKELMSDTGKFQECYRKLLDLIDSFNSISLSKVSSEVMLSTGVLMHEQLQKADNKLNDAIKSRK